MTRAQKVAKAQKLRTQGLLLREIAARMGAKTSTVHGWLSDPTLSRQRERRKNYEGTCKGCGTATDGSAGYAYAPELCASCFSAKQGEEGRARVLAAIKRWAGEYGRPPKSWEWQIERDDWPATNTVAYHFGSWAEGIRAAGFEPHGLSNPGRLSKKDRDNTVRLYRKGVSKSEIARRYGVTPNAIRERLANAGVLGTPCGTRGCRRSAVQHGLCPSCNNLRWLAEKAA